MASRTKLPTDVSVADLWKGVKDPATVWATHHQCADSYVPKHVVKIRTAEYAAAGLL